MCWNDLLQPNKSYFYWHLSRCERALPVRCVDGEWYGCDNAARTWTHTAFQAIWFCGWLYLGGMWLCGRVHLVFFKAKLIDPLPHYSLNQSVTYNCFLPLCLVQYCALKDQFRTSVIAWKDRACSMIDLCAVRSRSDLILHRALLTDCSYSH